MRGCPASPRRLLLELLRQLEGVCLTEQLPHELFHMLLHLLLRRLFHVLLCLPLHQLFHVLLRLLHIPLHLPLHLLRHQMLHPLLHPQPRQPSPIRRVLLEDGAGASMTRDPAKTLHPSALRRQILLRLATPLVTLCLSQILRQCV